MDDNTRFLKALLRQDWASYDALVADFERQGKGTPVAIIGAAFDLAVRRRFATSRDVQAIIRFVADARAVLAEGRDLPANEAEALIYATLDLEAPGVEDIIDGLDIGAIAEIEGQLLFKLITDEGLSEQQLNDFLLEAQALANQ